MSQLAGRKPVLEALKAGEEIEKIYLQFGMKGGALQEIKSLAKQQKIKILEVPPQKLKQICEHTNHQGVVAQKSLISYYELDDLIGYSLQKKQFLLLLDSIQDTHNLGAILRTAECAGIDGVITTTHNSAPINATVVKTSAGASEHIRICKVNNLIQAMKRLKEMGYWIGGSALAENSQDYRKIDYDRPIGLVMGNEEKGIRPATMKHCDFLIEIPMEGKIQSLNVSVATGVLLFQAMSGRKIK